MAGSTTSRPSISFAPPELKRFLGRRLVELGGIALAAVFLAAILAVATHDPADPSWNRAATGEISNLLGAPGAIFADLMLQLMGPIVLIVLAVPFCHAVRLVLHRPAAELKWRGAVTVFAACGGAMGLGALALWLDAAPAHFGGVLGASPLNARVVPLPPAVWLFVFALASLP